MQVVLVEVRAERFLPKPGDFAGAADVLDEEVAVPALSQPDELLPRHEVGGHGVDPVALPREPVSDLPIIRGEVVARYEVRYSPGNAELRKVGRAILFETTIVTHQPRLFDLTEALGQEGWLKALRLEDYVMRKPRQPQMLQEVLFSFLDAV